MDGIELTFAPETLDYIVDKAIEYKLGARGLRSLVETVMMDVMYDIPQTPTFVVTKDYAAERIESNERLQSA